MKITFQLRDFNGSQRSTPWQKVKRISLAIRDFHFFVCLVVLKGFAPEECEDNVISTSDTLIHPSGFFDGFKKRGKKCFLRIKTELTVCHMVMMTLLEDFFSWYAGIIYTPFLTASQSSGSMFRTTNAGRNLKKKAKKTNKKIICEAALSMWDPESDTVSVQI